MSSSEDGQTAKLRKSAIPLHKHKHGSAHDQRPHNHNFMLNVEKLFPLKELEDEECDDAAHGAGDEEEGVWGFLDVSLFWEVGDDGSDAAAFEAVEEEHEEVGGEVDSRS